MIVPSLGGQGTDAAGRRAPQGRLRRRWSARRSTARYPAGTVAYLSPGSGASVPTGSTVTIYVSDGTPYVAPQPPPQTQQPQNGDGNGNGERQRQRARNGKGRRRGGR